MAVLRLALQLAVLFLWLSSTRGGFRCPNNCNGHGKCSNDDVCHCKVGWDIVADCSQLRCPSGASWADKAYQLDTAHSLAECSNNGLCDRSTGVCSCFDGFEGAACHRHTCEQYCNGRGVCMTLGDLYRSYSPVGNGTARYLGWERNATTTCACDAGYAGGQCELRLCPKGNDPMTPQNGNFAIKIHTYKSSNGGAALSGNFKFCFQGQCFSFPALPSLWSNAKCKTAFESLPNIKQVNCTNNGTLAAYGQGTTYTVKFQRFPTNPYENNLWTHSGTPSVADFGCDASGVTGGLVGWSNNWYSTVYCIVTVDTSVGNVPEYEFCSRRGLCDLASGTCACYPGFYGLACSSYMPAATYISPADVLTLTTGNAAFSANVLHFANTIQGTAQWDNVLGGNSSFNSTAFDAYGNLTLIQGGLTVAGADGYGGVSIYTSGLSVTGGVSVSAGGQVANSIIFNDGGAAVTGGVTASGGLSILTRGLLVSSGGLTINTQGVQVMTGGLTVSAGGISVNVGRVNVYGGVTVAAGGLYVNTHAKGLTIASGGLNITLGGLSIGNVGGLVVTADTVFISGGARVNLYSSLTGNPTYCPSPAPASNPTCNFGAISNGRLDVFAGGVSISQTGLTVTGGTTVASGGLRLAAGKLSVVSGGAAVNGGVAVTGGVTIVNGGAAVSGGVNVTNLGLAVAGGISLPGYDSVSVYTSSSGAGPVTGTGMGSGQAGVYVQAGGVNTPSLAVMGGLSLLSPTTAPAIAVLSRGASVAGGVTVGNVGLTISSGGLATAGALTVTAEMVNLFGTTPFASGLSVTGGLTVLSAVGLNIAAGGVSINAGGVSVTSGGVSVGPVTIVGGLTVPSIGLRVQAQTLVIDGVTSTATGSDVGITVLDTGYTHATPPNDALVSYFPVHVLSGGLLLRSTATLGMTVSSLGLTVTDGLTIPDTGLYNKGFMTIASGGLSVIGGAIINGDVTTTFGVTVTDGLTVSDIGLSLNGPALTDLYTDGTNSDYGALGIAAGGLTIGSKGSLTAALLISADGLTVRGGVKLSDASGVVVSSGPLLIDSLNFPSFYQSSSAGNPIFTVKGGLAVTASNEGPMTSTTINYPGLYCGGATAYAAGTAYSGTGGTASFSSTLTVTATSIGTFVNSMRLVMASQLPGESVATVTASASGTTTLTVASTTSGMLANGMTISGTGVSGTVVLYGCSIIGGVGTCIMSSAQTITSTTITGTATSSVTLSNCVLTAGAGTCSLSSTQLILSTTLTASSYAVATAYSGTGGVSSASTTLTVTAALQGKMANGMTITGTGVSGTVVLSGCTIDSTGAGTCTMDSSQTIALSATITGSNKAVVRAYTGTGTVGSFSGVLTIGSTTSGTVVNGMALSDAFLTATVTLSACSLTGGAGTCTMSSFQTITLGSTVYGYLPTAIVTASASGTTTLTVASTTSGTLGNGMTITGTGVSGTVTLSGCSITAGAGTCIMSSAQTITSTTITGTPISTLSGGVTTTYLTAIDSGLVVSSGGLQVGAALAVSGGMTCWNSGITLSDVLKVQSSGLSVEGGGSVAAGGVVVSTGPVAVFTAGTGGAASATLTITFTATGAVANGMTLSGNGVVGTVTLSACSLTSGTGTCTLSSSQTIADGSALVGTGATASATAVFVTGTPIADPSIYLAVASTSSGTIAAGMTVTGTGISGTVVLTGCSVSLGVGVCNMDELLSLAAGTTVTAYTTAVVTASAMGVTTLTIASTSQGTLANGMTITGPGVVGTVTLSGCSITAGAGTCTMSSVQTIVSTSITGSVQSAVVVTGTPYSHYLSIASTTSGTVINGMSVTGTGLTGAIWLSGCSLSGGVGSCAMNVALPIASGVSIQGVWSTGLLSNSLGMAVTGGLAISPQGLFVVSAAASAVLSGGINLPNLGLFDATVADALTITAGGMTIGAGMTVTAGGMTVAASGLAVTSGGVKVTDAGVAIVGSVNMGNFLSSTADGLTVTNGAISPLSVSFTSGLAPTNVLQIASGGATIANDMYISLATATLSSSWTSGNYVRVGGCSITGNAGTCMLHYVLGSPTCYQYIAASTSIVGSYPSAAAQCYSGTAASPGVASTTLTCRQMQVGFFTAGMAVYGAGLGVTLSGCSITAGAGTCIMSSAQTITSTTMTGTSIAVVTATGQDTTLSIGSTNVGTMANGMTITGIGVSGTVTLSGCSIDAGGGGTCTMSSAQSFATTSITGTSIATVTASASGTTTLTVASTTSGTLANGMTISGTGVAAVTFTACNIDDTTATGSCTMSSSQTVAVDTPVAGIKAGTAAVTTATAPSTTLVIASTASAQLSVANGMTITGTGVSGTVTLSGCTIDSNGAGTCTMSTTQYLTAGAALTASTPSTAVFVAYSGSGGASSNSATLTITSTTSGTVVNGMTITGTGIVGTVIVRGCVLTGAGVGTCYMDSLQTIDFSPARTITGTATTSALYIESQGLSVHESITAVDTGVMITGDLKVDGAVDDGGALRLSQAPSLITSDARLKTNITPIHDALGRLQRMPAVYFRWKDREALTALPGDAAPLARDDHLHVGFVAQDVLAALPEAVKRGPGSYLGVSYASLAPVLVEAIRELASRAAAPPRERRDGTQRGLEAEVEVEGKEKEKEGKEAEEAVVEEEEEEERDMAALQRAVSELGRSLADAERQDAELRAGLTARPKKI